MAVMPRNQLITTSHKEKQMDRREQKYPPNRGEEDEEYEESPWDF